MHAKLFDFYPTTVKYSFLTGTWALIALNNTACSANPFFPHVHNLTEISKKKLLGRCSPVASFTETSPFFPSFCWLGCPEQFLQPSAPAGWWQGLPLLPAAPEGCISWEAAALERSSVVFWAFSNHFDCRADWGGAWFEVSWAQSLCWGLETESRILLCHLNIRLFHAARFFFLDRFLKSALGNALWQCLIATVCAGRHPLFSIQNWLCVGA